MAGHDRQSANRSHLPRPGEKRFGETLRSNGDVSNDDRVVILQ
jgi:hypothetical protein